MSGPRQKKACTKRPTEKQRRYIEGRVTGKSRRRAALDAGYSKSVANNASREIERRPTVRRFVEEILALAQISDELLALRIKEGLDATQTKVAKNKNGKVADERTVVDYRERREMLVIVLKLKGYLVKRHEVSGPTLEELLERSYEDQ